SRRSLPGSTFPGGAWERGPHNPIYNAPAPRLPALPSLAAVIQSIPAVLPHLPRHLRHVLSSVVVGADRAVSRAATLPRRRPVARGGLPPADDARPLVGATHRRPHRAGPPPRRLARVGAGEGEEALPAD